MKTTLPIQNKNPNKSTLQTGLLLGSASLIGSMLLTPTVATAADQYVFGYYSATDLSDSSNSGNFPNGFTTGAGTTVPAGTSLPAGASVAWDTEFDTGDSFAIGYGRKLSNGWRGEIELSQQDNDVERHSGITVLDNLAIDTEDAGILISGSNNLGASVGAIVADGRGSVDSTYLMLNAYYDFMPEASFTPFAGVGIGYVDADIVFNPSGVGIVDDNDSNFAYQVAAGASYALTDSLELIGQVKYRASDDFEVSTTLFPAELEIENETSSLDIGLRYNF